MNGSPIILNLSRLAADAPPGANYLMVAIVFLFFGTAILVIALISEIMIPFDFSFLFWITGICFFIALISFVVALIVREKYGRSDNQARGIVKDEGYQGTVLRETSSEDKWTPQQVEKWQRKDFGRADRFASLTSSDFKELVIEIFRRLDYSVERSTYHADFAIDLIARKGEEVISIEVKKWKRGRDVGTEIVRRALEARWKCAANKSVIITTSGFTPKAKVLARKNPIELWDFNKLSSLIEEHLLKGGT